MPERAFGTGCGENRNRLRREPATKPRERRTWSCSVRRAGKHSDPGWLGRNRAGHRGAAATAGRRGHRMVGCAPRGRPAGGVHPVRRADPGGAQRHRRRRGASHRRADRKRLHHRRRPATAGSGSPEPAGRQSGGGRRCRLNPKPEEALMRPLTEQAILITGATDGHGLALATELAARGATVLLHGRDDARGRQAIADIGARTGNDRLHWLRADLASLDQVRDLADRVLAGHPRLDAMINNAGIGTTTGGSRQRLESRDGYELRFGVNYLAGYLLTRLLLPRMQDCAPARIVNVASAGQAPIDFDDVMLERHYDGVQAYCQSKLALVMVTFDLAEELAGTGDTANCLHPATYMPTKMVLAARGSGVSSIEEGVQATTHLIAAPELEHVTGRYFHGLALGARREPGL